MALIFRSESRTFTDVSSVWIVPHRRISVFIRSYSGSSILAAPAIQSQRVERDSSTPCRASRRSWRWSGIWSAYFSVIT